jgi:RNA polymerase sigma-70 factor (ECF subfamily)
MSERWVRHQNEQKRPAGTQGREPHAAQAQKVEETRLAVRIRELVEHGDLEPARAAFAELVAAQQRRALRIAYHYLRDGAEADEAVQDAFLKAFVHIKSYRDSWPFEVWFTRILINGCLDRQKARARRERWFASAPDPAAEPAPSGGGEGADPEALLLSRERRARLAAAVNRLEGRQRSVFIMCHFGDCTPREVSAITGLNETTVRVHLFRAARKLRVLLGGTP